MEKAASMPMAEGGRANLLCLYECTKLEISSSWEVWGRRSPLCRITKETPQQPPIMQREGFRLLL